MPPHSVLLIYISADGCESHGKSTEGPYDRGGLYTNNKRELSNQQANSSETKVDTIIKKSFNFKEAHCIYPGDLIAFTRKPLFLIIDSTTSAAFQVNNICNLIEQVDLYLYFQGVSSNVWSTIGFIFVANTFTRNISRY